MSDLSTTIRINDGFSEPLKNLSKAALAARDPIDSLKEAIKEVHEETDYEAVAMDSLFYAVDKSVQKIEKILKKQFKALKKQTKPLMKLIKKSLPKELKNIEKTVEKTSHAFIKAAKNSDIYKKSLEKVASLRKSFNFKMTEMKFNAANLRFNATAHGGYFKYARDMFAEKSPRAAKFVKRTYESASDNVKIAKEMVKEFGIKDTAKAYKSLIGQKLSGTKFSEGFSKGQAKFTELENLVKGRAAYWKNVADINGVGKTAQAFGAIQKIRIERAFGSVLNKIQGTSGVQAFMKARERGGGIGRSLSSASKAFWYGDVKSSKLFKTTTEYYAKGLNALKNSTGGKAFMKAQARGGGVFRSLSSAGKAVWYDDIKTSKGFKFAQKEFAEFKKFSTQKLDIMRREVAFKATSAKMSLKIAMDEFKWRTAFLKTDLLHAKNVAIKKGRQGLEIARNFIEKQKAIIDKKGLSWYINDISKGPKGKGVVGAFRRNIFDPRKGIIDRARELGHKAQKTGAKAVKYLKTHDIKQMTHDFTQLVKNGVSKGFSAVANSGPAKFFGGFAKDFGKMFGAQILSNVLLKAASKLKDKMLDAGHALVDAINNSLDELTLSDKFSAMYGEAGKGAQARAYELANELGESAGMVGEMSMRAAKEGIGTDQFEQIMRLSDRISSLSIGTTTGDVANDLMANIKSNHDAGSLAQMLGGGEMMERKIRRSGYERALNRGDVNKALEIAEQIAKEAGFTDEKYKEASESMSQNFQGIMNHVDNIKKRLGEAYVEGLAPVVKRIKEIMDSPKFKRIIDVLHFGVQKIGEIINKIMMKVLGNTKTLGVMFGVGVALKIWLCAIRLKQTVGLIGLIMKLGRILGNTVLGKIIKKLIVELGLRKAIAKMAKTALKGGLIIGAIALAAKILHNIFGKGKSFMDFLKGALLGVVQIIMNVFTNIKVFYERVKGFFAIGFGLLHKKIVKGIHWLKKTLLDVFSNVIYKVVDLISDSVIGDILERTLDIDMEDAADDLVDKLADFVNIEDTEEKLAQIDSTIKSIEEGLPEYIGWTEGFEESIKTNGQSVIDKLDKMIPNLSDIAKKATGIAGDTNKIRKTNEQEEELRWMKAFSDRQISSAYNQTVSQVHNMTVNGAPQTMMAHVRQFYINAHATNYRRLH
jgi:hypothetical protein